MENVKINYENDIMEIVETLNKVLASKDSILEVDKAKLELFKNENMYTHLIEELESDIQHKQYEVDEINLILSKPTFYNLTRAYTRELVNSPILDSIAYKKDVMTKALELVNEKKALDEKEKVKQENKAQILSTDYVCFVLCVLGIVLLCVSSLTTGNILNIDNNILRVLGIILLGIYAFVKGGIKYHSKK